MSTTLLLSLLVACSPQGTGSTGSATGGTAPPEFSVDSAWAYLRRQVGFGPRYPGSDGHRQQLAWMQEFLRALVIYSESTGAGPDNAALFYMVNLYREAFVYFKMGYASALAWGLFLVALLITIALFAGARRYVYYASER